MFALALLSLFTAAPAEMPPTPVLAGRAFDALVHRTDAVCPARHIRSITPGDLDWEQEGFEESLARPARARLAATNQADRRCAGHNGLACPVTATLEAMQRTHMTGQFARYVCGHLPPA